MQILLKSRLPDHLTITDKTRCDRADPELFTKFFKISPFIDYKPFFHVTPAACFFL